MHRSDFCCYSALGDFYLNFKKFKKLFQLKGLPDSEIAYISVNTLLACKCLLFISIICSNSKPPVIGQTPNFAAIAIRKLRIVY